MSLGGKADTAAEDRDALATLTLDLDALASNWRFLADRAVPAEVAAVVKADAYGIGIAAAVPALARAGCRTFFVAHVGEGRRARSALRDNGLDAPRIYVLNGFRPDAAPARDYAAHDLGPVLGSAEELAAWEGFALQAGLGAFCALHVDTGMNRLGFPVEEARLLPRARLDGARVALVMSHLVSAEVPSDPRNKAQIAAFEHARERALKPLPASLANSSGIFLPQRPTFDLVRPGYALYGGNPTPGAPNPMRPVVGLSAPILQVRDVPAGAGVGYNAAWIAPKASRLATIGVGYADGFPFGAGGVGGRGAAGVIAGVPCPVIGRISMDLTILDVSALDADAVRPGAPVELLGPHMDVDELGRRAGTIGYEILTRLGPRYRRQYLREGALVGPPGAEGADVAGGVHRAS